MTVLAGSHRIDYSPAIGSELPGVQLTELDNAGIRAIAQLAAERCMLVFRDRPTVLATPGARRPGRRSPGLRALDPGRGTRLDR